MTKPIWEKLLEGAELDLREDRYDAAYDKIRRIRVALSNGTMTKPLKLVLKAVVYSIVTVIVFGAILGGLALIVKLVGPPAFFLSFMFVALVAFWVAMLQLHPPRRRRP